MIEFERFANKCKMRHDFSDQIQVRYRHTDGQDYDTWVSGEEVLQRMRSGVAEARLKALRNLDFKSLKNAKEELPKKGKERFRDRLREHLGDSVDEFVGDSLIGDSLAGAVRGESEEDDPRTAEKKRWQVHMAQPRFRIIALDLAWIQLAGSFPDDEPSAPLDDWM